MEVEEDLPTKVGAESRGGGHPPVGRWDKVNDDGAEALRTALQHPVRQGQGIALLDTRAAAKNKNTIRMKT